MLQRHGRLQSLLRWLTTTTSLAVTWLLPQPLRAHEKRHPRDSGWVRFACALSEEEEEEEEEEKEVGRMMGGELAESVESRLRVPGKLRDLARHQQRNLALFTA